MSDAVSVDENPVIADSDLPQDDAAPVVELPGQLTFGWGDDFAASKSKKDRKKKTEKSKKSKSVRARQSKSKIEPKKADTVSPAPKAAQAEPTIGESGLSEITPAAAKSPKKRKAGGAVKVSKPARTARRRPARKDAAGLGTAASKAPDMSVTNADSAASKETTAAAMTVGEAAKKVVGRKRAKKKRVLTSRKATVKQPSANADVVSPRTPPQTTAEASPRTEASPKPLPASSAQTESYADTVDYLPLKWGAKLPSVGFGFWKVEKDQTAQVCYEAIQVGYRHLDCACDYGNEEEVGQGIRKAISDGLVEREDLWVTSKLWNTYHAPEHVRMACEKSLADLQLDYLDLYLIHFPLAQRYVPIETRYPPGWFFDPDVANPVVEEARVSIQETWQALEELTKEGLVRNIGICNFGTSQIRDLLTYAHIRPAVLQVETHPRLTQQKLLRYCQQEKIAYTAFSPLGAQSYYSLNMADPSESLLKHPVVKAIAEQVKRTAAQVLLRWGVQRGTAVIPKTSSKDRMIENICVFDFELSGEQMQLLDGLDEGRRFNDPGDFGEAAFNTYLPIYE